ncbi:hypothetical protein FHR81_001825 [Actinoalloteichus hoggarensis]|nr:hypothetical protein [Actinoalloteichus hoggarensis]
MARGRAESGNQRRFRVVVVTAALVNVLFLFDGSTVV